MTILRRGINISISGRKLISTNPAKCTVEAVNVSKREDYYKNLAEEDPDAKPEGWDEALPYKAMPGPRPLPFVGNLWRFFPYIGEYHNVPMPEFYGRLHKKYGNIVNMKFFPGRAPLVVIFNPKDMEHVLRNAGPFPIRDALDSFSYYRSKIRKDVFKGVGGLLTVQGEDWYKFRTVVNPILMQPKTVMQYVVKMDQVAGELVENMRYFSTQNENNEMPKDFVDELYKWALESVGVIALEKHFGCLNLNLEKGSEPDKLISNVNELVDLLFKFEMLPSLWKVMSTSSWKRYVEILDYLTETIQKYIDEALNQPIDENLPDDKLSVVQKLAKQDKLVAFTMAMDMILAGIDTTGKTMAATLYLLAKNPQKQELLRKEAIKNLPEKKSVVTQQVLAKSPYLKAVIKESTRMAPIAIGNGRTMVKDIVIGGYQVPKKTQIIALNMLTSRTDEFKDPDEFIPERWLRSTEGELSYKNAHPFAFLPFGFGPRSCVGKRIANLELEVALTKIVRNFKLSWHHEDMLFASKMTYGVASPLTLKIEPVEK